MVSNCTVQTNFVEQYRGGLFENTGFIFFFHRAAIRFGKPDDIQLVLEGTEEEQTDYVRGLLASSITIFAIFVFWMLLVLAFKCLGPYAAGILSGRRVPLPPKPQIQDFADDQVYQSQLETWTKNYDGTARGDKFMKGILVFAGLSIVTSSILLSVKGVTSLIKSLDDALATIEVVKVLVNDGIDLINKILASEDTTEEFVVDVLTSMNSMCLDLRDPFCTNITDIDTCNFEGVADENLLKDFFISWENLRQLKYEDLVKSKGDLEDIYDELVELNNTGDTFNWAFWCSMAFSLCLALLCLIMLAGAFFKLSRVTKILRKCILVPSFILMVILSWVFSMVFVIGSVGLADMCYDSPDTFISGLFTKYKDGFSPLIFRSVLFYVNGCPLENFPSGLVDHINMLVQARLTIANADVSFATNVLCSTDPKPVIFFSNAASSQICKLTELFQDIRLYFGCDNWFPLYEQSVYTAMCYSGTDGFAWVTSTQCVIVFMSMIILTFRVAFYDIEIEGAKEEMKLVENDESQNEDSDKDGDDGRNEEDSEK